MNDRWRQIERVYHAARELDTSAQVEFLAKACAGDDALREEVESLLMQADESASFLQSPAIEVAAKALAREQRVADPPNAAVELGAMLGHYRLTGKLGTGGMGEVYRARDIKLQRDVALKILPEAMAHDAERMTRFEREAQVLASLNHPNIAAIHGLEESNGVRALVMELAEGETLAERIGKSHGERPVVDERRSGPSTDECLGIARQIAEALEYAHERGVIHRDLKPANVKITPEGTVKVLDFGLAKVLSPQGSSTILDPASPTLSAMATQAGMILGTAAYMSPEQAKGQRVDRRCDIWAFGCVLYEMLSGRKAFEGESLSEVFAAVLTKEPDWGALPETTPLTIRKLLRRCLQKDPRQRLQAIGDARIAIEEAILGDAGENGTSAIGGTAPELPRESPLRRALPWLVAAALVAWVVLFAASHFQQSGAPAHSIRLHILPPEEASFTQGPALPVLSPDGTRLVFADIDASGNKALWVRPLDSLSARLLNGTEGAVRPFWAPDSRQLAFFQNGKLRKIDVTGGPPVTIYDVSTWGSGGAWNGDNGIVYAPGASSDLFTLPAAGGMPSPIAGPGGPAGNVSLWPVFLPDGRHFLFLSGNVSALGTPKLGIYVSELGSKGAKFLLQADSQALYSPPGYLLFLRGDTLMAQSFDAAGLKLEGEALPLAEHVATTLHDRLGLFSVSQTGLLVYATSTGTAGGQLVWMDSKGKEIGKVGQPGPVDPRLSPDGRLLTYFVRHPSGTNADIWLMDLTRGVTTRLTFEPSTSPRAVWSPDGSRIVYSSGSGNNRDLYVKNSSGTGRAELLFKSSVPKWPDDWSRDGRYILFDAWSGKGTNVDIWAFPLFGDRKPFPYAHTSFNEIYAAFSPNTRWVAYQSNETGNYEVYLASFPSGAGKWQVSQGGGTQPEWNRDGTSLYYRVPGGKLMEASVCEKGSKVEIGTPRELFQANFLLHELFGRVFDVAPDGKRFLVDIAQQGASQPLTLVTNWTAELKK